MDTQTATAFFMWCTIINLVVFTLTTLLIIMTPDFIFRIQGRLFNVSRESFDKIVYAWLGLYKLIILTFNLVPFLALLLLKWHVHPLH